MRITSTYNDWLPEDRMWGSYLLESVKEGMAPFPVYSGEFYYDYDIDHDMYRITAEAKLPCGWRVVHTVRMERQDFLFDTTWAMAEACRLFTIGFRNREDFPLAPLIELGEN